LMLNNGFIVSVKSLICYLNTQLQRDTVKYTTKICLITFLSEICKTFFTFPEMLSNLKIFKNDYTSDQSYFEDNVFFSILMELFKTDQIVKEYESKKMIRRAIIVCLSFDEVAYSPYLENESFICEILTEKLCTHFQMCPEYF